MNEKDTPQNGKTPDQKSQYYRMFVGYCLQKHTLVALNHLALHLNHWQRVGNSLTPIGRMKWNGFMAQQNK